jgi:D-glycero-D-manno-heptose 1,7-bisphosphate phosphatase
MTSDMDFNKWLAQTVIYRSDGVEEYWQDTWALISTSFKESLPAGTLRIETTPPDGDFGFWLKRALKREEAQAALYNEKIDQLEGLAIYWNQKVKVIDDESPCLLPMTPKGKFSALLLDRDGVINQDGGYTYRSENVSFVPHIEDIIKFANELDIKVIVLTNQSEVVQLHQWMSAELEKKGAKIDAWYYSPFHPESDLPQYKKASYTRKPHPGMALIASKEQDIALNKSLMIGDKVSDVLKTVDIKTLLIRGNYELGDYPDTFNNHLEILTEVKNFFSLL